MTNFDFYDIIKSPNKDEVLKMKLATNKWNVRIIINGKAEVPFYYGFKTKREAQSEADRWISKGFEFLLIRYFQSLLYYTFYVPFFFFSFVIILYHIYCYLSIILQEKILVKMYKYFI